MNFVSPPPYTSDWRRDCKEMYAYLMASQLRFSYSLFASHLFSLFREKSSLPRAF